MQIKFLNFLFFFFCPSSCSSCSFSSSLKATVRRRPWRPAGVSSVDGRGCRRLLTLDNVLWSSHRQNLIITTIIINITSVIRRSGSSSSSQ